MKEVRGQEKAAMSVNFQCSVQEANFSAMIASFTSLACDSTPSQVRTLT